jgi:radical SAM protein with 4Fe4S-binding SPASM domain
VALYLHGLKVGVSLVGRWHIPYANMAIGLEDERSMANCPAFLGRSVTLLPDGNICQCHFTSETLTTFEGWDTYYKSDAFFAASQRRWLGKLKECSGCELEGTCLGGCFVTWADRSARGQLGERGSPLGSMCQFIRGAATKLFEHRLSQIRR